MAYWHKSEVGRWGALATALFAAGMLAACNGDGSSGGGGGSANSSVQGTVATGAAATNALVSVKCQNGYTTTSTTGSDGAFTLSVPTVALACALQASGGSLPTGTTLHSLATANGVTNITPLTDLVVAHALGKTPADWFNASPAASLGVLAGKIDASDSAVIDKMKAQGYVLPDGTFNSRTSKFSPVKGNPYDDFLESLKASVDKTTDGYQGLLASVAQGNLDAIPKNESGGSTPGCQDDCKAFLNKMVDDFAATPSSDGAWQVDGDVVTFKVAATQSDVREAGPLNEAFPVSGTNLKYLLKVDRKTGEITVDNTGGFTAVMNSFTEAVAYQEIDYGQTDLADINKSHYAYITFDPKTKANSVDKRVSLRRTWKEMDGSESDLPGASVSISSLCSTGDMAGYYVCDTVMLNSNPKPAADPS